MSDQPPAPETIAAALPREVTLTRVVQAFVALGIPADIARWTTEVRIEPKAIEVEVATNLAGSRMRLTLHVDSRAGVAWGDVNGVPQ